MGLNTRKLVLLLIAITVIDFLDTGVEASKSGKKHSHRSKRMHGDKPHRHAKKEKREPFFQPENEASQPKLIESQKNFHDQEKDKKIKLKDDFELTPTLMKEYLKRQQKIKEEKLRKQKELDDTTVLPTIHAKVDFFMKKEAGDLYYPPPTTSSIGDFSSSELGLKSFHNAIGLYGLHSRPEQVFGRLIHISDAGRKNSHFACGNAIANLNEIPKTKPWIAMVQRGHCSFFTKIKLAERNNATAVIIYDKEDEELPRINTIGTNIVSVIIGKHDGHAVAKSIERNAEVLVNIAIHSPTDVVPPADVTTALAMYNDAKIVNHPPRGGAQSNKFSTVTLLMLAMIMSFHQVMMIS